MALFLFLVAKAVLSYLPSAYFVALRLPFPFQQASMLKFFCWSLRHSACFLLVSEAPTSLPILFFSPLLWLSVGPRHPILSSVFFLPQYLWQIWQELPFLSSCTIRQQLTFCTIRLLYTRFSRGTTRLMSWPDGERYLSFLQFHVVSLLLSFVFTLLFSRTGAVLHHLNSLTNRFPRFPMRNLCSLVTLAVPSLVFATTDIVSVKLLSL